MPYFGREPQGILANTIEGNLKVTGTISADSINDKLALNGSDTSSPQSNANDQIVLEAGTLDDSTHTSVVPAMAATDNLLLEDVTPSQAEVSLASIAAGGTSGQVLQSQGSLVTPAFVTSAATGYEFISSVTASASSEAALTGMESGYDYLCEAYDIIPAADDRSLYMQFGTGSTPSYQSTNYIFGAYGRFNNDLANSFNHENAHGNHQQVKVIAQNAGTSTNETVGFSIKIMNPSDSGSPTFFDGQGFGKTATTQAGVNDISGFYNADSAVTAAKFYFSSSTNIAQGKFFFYRRANA